MIEKYYIKQTSCATDFGQALQDVFTALKPYKGKAFKLTAFVDAKDRVDYIDKQNLLSSAIDSCFGEDCPTWSLLSEAPRNATLCVVLICSESPRTYIDFRGMPIVILEQGVERELWVSGLASLDEDMQAASTEVFETLSLVLSEHGFEYDDIVRQWNYIGEILKTKLEDGACTQNYQIFNNTRNAYYRRNKQLQDFPAATGIGKKIPGLIVDVFARKPCDGVQSLPLRSQVQKNPFTYSEAVLVGDSNDKKPPLFERARMLYSDRLAQIFVSGTASIKDQETVAIGDVSAQTGYTIQCINELIALQNIRNNYPKTTLETLTYERVRVYVKRRDDIETVFNICSAHYPEHVINIVEADICRDNLLVEIEADLIMK